MTREVWDRAAASFDEEPDHGLAGVRTRAAWRDLLLDVLPAAPARVADIGCGTGTLTRLLVDNGYTVDGLDFSPEMIKRARQKVPEARFVVSDASDPTFKSGTYDVALGRHVLWALPDPAAAFTSWVRLLKPGGVAVLIEGRWDTGAGLSAEDTERIVRTVCTIATVRHLPESVYWGKENQRRALPVDLQCLISAPSNGRQQVDATCCRMNGRPPRTVGSDLWGQPWHPLPHQHFRSAAAESIHRVASARRSPHRCRR